MSTTGTTTGTTPGTDSSGTNPSGGPGVGKAGRRGALLVKLLNSHGALIGIAVLAFLLLVWAPGSMSTFRLGNLGKYCALALASMGVGLAWGRGGMLVMGQGVFFGLGAYAMAMHMKLEAAGPGEVPDFMTLYGDGTMPFWWEPFRSGPFTLFAIVALPAAVSFLLGYAILKRRVKGAYFAILTQAMAVAFATLLIATIKQTGGFNGLNTFSTVFGHNLYNPEVQKNLYRLAAGLVILFLVILWQLYRSRYGELLVATRDAEERIRFLGYDPANIKLVAFMAAAVMASIGGAVFVPIAGIISPSNVDAAASIMLLAGVALGGRASLFGPALGAIAVGYGRSTLSERYPTKWTYFLGALFIVVVLFLPGGVASLWTKLRSWWSSSVTERRATVSAGEPTRDGLDHGLDHGLEPAQRTASA
ncbi:MAG TPA: urea ABC transporter permease subunit UrtC [Ilumatobacter sp.]|nr:urea ABC transporter permease subunit UrtC [Ilumatobacter sp.]